MEDDFQWAFEAKSIFTALNMQPRGLQNRVAIISRRANSLFSCCDIINIISRYATRSDAYALFFTLFHFLCAKETGTMNLSNAWQANNSHILLKTLTMAIKFNVLYLNQLYSKEIYVSFKKALYARVTRMSHFISYNLSHLSYVILKKRIFIAQCFWFLHVTG